MTTYDDPDTWTGGRLPSRRPLEVLRDRSLVLGVLLDFHAAAAQSRPPLPPELEGALRKLSRDFCRLYDTEPGKDTDG